MGINFFLNRNKDRLKARHAQDIRSNHDPISLSWEDLWEEEMPVLREGTDCFEMEQALRIVMVEMQSADRKERMNERWELYTNT